MVDFVLALAILIVMMFFYGYSLNLTTLLAIPFLSLMLVLIAFGFSLWLSALNVSYRDVRYLVPFLIQILLFATPVIYPSTLIDKSARIFYGLNPMVNVVDGFRWALLDTPSPPGLSVAISLALSVVLLISGLLFFSRAEGTITDIV
jgi:lipopolysaccharide transport system permease protein